MSDLGDPGGEVDEEEPEKADSPIADDSEEDEDDICRLFSNPVAVEVAADGGVRGNAEIVGETATPAG